MRVPITWLKELTPCDWDAKKIAERLTMAGFEVEEIHDIDGEMVLDLKVTSNRGDALSLIGIAREVAALCGKKVVKPAITVAETGKDVNKLAAVEVKDPEWCPRYAARVVTGVVIAPSPAWVQKRLVEAGVRPISNVVDVTNYVMLEMGQPLHAFDLDKLTDQKIIVRRAEIDEPFSTLDGIERKLTDRMLVIADAAHPVALAGIMGGLESEVTDNTVNVLIESANFDRTCIRKTARANILSTESSYRFERIVDPANAVNAVNRAAQLMKEWAGGEIATGVIDVCAPLPPQRTITVRPARVNKVLGTEIARIDMEKVFNALDIEYILNVDDMIVSVPTFRPDLVEEMDMIEEIARIYGYEHVPITVPGKIVKAGRLAPEMAFENRLREILTSAGLYEGLSYSLIDYRTLDAMLLTDGTAEKDEIVPLRNPKSEEYSHLRPSMMPSMLESLKNNARRSLNDVQIFELGRIFRNTGGGLRFNYNNLDRTVNGDIRVQDGHLIPLEKRAVGIAIMGRPWTSRWGGGDNPVDFFWLKGIIEGLIAGLQISGVEYLPVTHPTLHPGRTAEVVKDGVRLALFGEVHPRAATNFDLPGRAYIAEIDVEALMDFAGEDTTRPNLSRFQAVDRDIAFLVAIDKPASEITAVISEAGGEIRESVALFDLYQGKNIPEGQRSLAYRITFRADARTLEDKEVDAAMTNIRAALTAAGAILR